MDPPPFSSLSTVDIKEMLHKKQIDSVGIYDREALIQLALGKAQEIDFGSQIPESYIELFEVMGFFIIFYQQIENKRKDLAEERIREYLKRVKQSQAMTPTYSQQESIESSILPLTIIYRRKDDRWLAIVVENMPAKYKEEEICIFLNLLFKNSQVFVTGGRGSINAIVRWD